MITDKETVELSELCSAVIDETITEQQKDRLSHLLSTSEEARKFYVRMTGLSASMFYYAGEMQTGAADAPHKRSILKTFTWITTTFALAASLAILAWAASPWMVRSTKAAEPDPQFVARLTASKDCEWVDGTLPLGGRVEEGQTLQLAAGYAEITFDSGASIVLQGPATITANSAWSAMLTRGTLKATVPAPAVGFSVANSTVKVVDFGTEFVMSAGSTTTDLLVLKGQVEATSHASSDQLPVLLNVNESRRFASNGVSSMPEAALNSDKWAHPLALDRFIAPTTYAHWSFDEPVGTAFAAQSVGLSSPAFPPEIRNVLDPSPSFLHVKGHVNGALEFDGHTYARIPMPGISEDTPHTIAFWVKVPKDASLSNAYAMAAWNPNHKTVGFHPIHICWNRSPDEGVVGALRTDYGRGFAMGATPLRDNRWHHIAVVVIPPENPKTFMEVKQYVDGRLEGEGNIAPSGSDVFDASNSGSPPASAGALWLGSRLGIKTVRTERFRGAMDELFVFNRPLDPQEIERLMLTNQP